jgi:hypothetical protein
MKLLQEPASNFNELVVLFGTFGLVCPSNLFVKTTTDERLCTFPKP